MKTFFTIKFLYFVQTRAQNSYVFWGEKNPIFFFFFFPIFFYQNLVDSLRIGKLSREATLSKLICLLKRDLLKDAPLRVNFFFQKGLDVKQSKQKVNEMLYL